MVGPRLENPDGSFQTGPTPFPSLWNEFLSVTGIGRRLTYRGYPSRRTSSSRPRNRTDYVVGACMLARREAIDAVGGLDERYFMYSEEPDWCWRMSEAGWETWYTPTPSSPILAARAPGRCARRCSSPSIAARYDSSGSTVVPRRRPV